MDLLFVFLTPDWISFVLTLGGGDFFDTPKIFPPVIVVEGLYPWESIDGFGVYLQVGKSGSPKRMWQVLSVLEFFLFPT